MLYLSRFASQLTKVLLWVDKASYLIPIIMVSLLSSVVLLRYGFDSGSIKMQETVAYLLTLLVVWGAGTNWLVDEHVRIDTFSHRFNEKTRAIIDIIGSLILVLPFCVFMLYISIDFVSLSWNFLESSADSDGLALVWLQKSFLLIYPFSLFLSCSCVLIKKSSLLLNEYIQPR